MNKPNDDMPVLMVYGRAYGPEDVVSGKLAGEAMVHSEAVEVYAMSLDTLDAFCRWLGQSKQHGQRWIGKVLESQAKVKRIANKNKETKA